MGEKRQPDPRRAEGQRLLDALADDYADLREVTRAPMFGSTGLRTSGGFFAFVGAVGDLILKVPHEQATALVEEGTAGPVKRGRGTMREWVSLPLDEGAAEQWRARLADGYRYAIAR